MAFKATPGVGYNLSFKYAVLVTFPLVLALCWVVHRLAVAEKPKARFSLFGRYYST